MYGYLDNVPTWFPFALAAVMLAGGIIMVKIPDRGRRDSDRIQSLDGMRAVSALLVMVSHFGLQHIVPGGLGVTTFFFISGYLITTLLLREIDRTGTIDIQAFYRRRFWRLWPAIAAAVVGVVLIGFAFGETWSPVGHVVSSLLFVQNYWSVVSPATNPLNIHWSLAVEWHFYLIWPFALLALQIKRSLAVPVIAAAIVTVLMFRLWVVFALQVSGAPFEDINEWTYELTHLRFDALLFGCLLACMAHDRTLLYYVGAARGWGIWAGLAVLLASILFRDDIYRATFRYSLQGCGLFMIFAGLLYAPRARFFRWALNLPIMVWLGTISFSIYLWHLTIWRAIREFTGRIEGGADLAVIAFVLTILMAWISYRWIERPCQRLRAALFASKYSARYFDQPLIEFISFAKLFCGRHVRQDQLLK